MSADSLLVSATLSLLAVAFLTSCACLESCLRSRIVLDCRAVTPHRGVASQLFDSPESHKCLFLSHMCWRLCFLTPKAWGLFQERNSVMLPLAMQPGAALALTTVDILKRFEFDASLMRSGVVVADKAAPGDALLVVRGAPSRIQALVTPGMLPPDFNQVRPCCCLAKQEGCCHHVSNMAALRLHTAGNSHEHLLLLYKTIECSGLCIDTKSEHMLRLICHSVGCLQLLVDCFEHQVASSNTVLHWFEHTGGCRSCT